MRLRLIAAAAIAAAALVTSASATPLAARTVATQDGPGACKTYGHTTSSGHLLSAGVCVYLMRTSDKKVHFAEICTGNLAAGKVRATALPVRRKTSSGWVNYDGTAPPIFAPPGFCLDGPHVGTGTHLIDAQATFHIVWNDGYKGSSHTVATPEYRSGT